VTYLRRCLPAVVIALVGCVGCAPSGPRSQVQTAATGFVTAIRDSDGATACAALTQAARESVTGLTEVSCAQAVLKLRESGVGIQSAQVWGDNAQVRIGSDVLFLRRFSGGWLVDGAGCRPQSHAPYQCDVEG
jgi:hypothetical protein